MKIMIGYVATIENKNGGVSYKGVDPTSGYPFFDTIPHIKETMIEAINDVKQLDCMNGYFGSDKHNFKNINVNRVFLEVVDDISVDREQKKQLIEKINRTFTKEEIKLFENLYKTL